jgi:hypothetical protein
MRLTINPTTMAEIENRKKNEEPSRPNCSGSSFSSVMIGTPARPTTILSAKFTSMKRNSRNVIFQAPLGVGCTIMVVPSLSLFLAQLERGRPDATQGLSAGATGHFGSLRLRCNSRLLAGRCLTMFRKRVATDHDRVAAVIEAVICGHGLGMLSGHQGVFMRHTLRMTSETRSC